jgi:hypothetical protein
VILLLVLALLITAAALAAPADPPETRERFRLAIQPPRGTGGAVRDGYPVRTDDGHGFPGGPDGS